MGEHDNIEPNEPPAMPHTEPDWATAAATRVYATYKPMPPVDFGSMAARHALEPAIASALRAAHASGAAEERARVREAIHVVPEIELASLVYQESDVQHPGRGGNGAHGAEAVRHRLLAALAPADAALRAPTPYLVVYSPSRRGCRHAINPTTGRTPSPADVEAIAARSAAEAGYFASDVLLYSKAAQCHADRGTLLAAVAALQSERDATGKLLTASSTMALASLNRTVATISRERDDAQTALRVLGEEVAGLRAERARR